MPKQIPDPPAFTKPFWDALNEDRLTVQQCSKCSRLMYPPKQKCDQCGSADYGWKDVEGKGHVLEYFVIRDSRIKRLQGEQPLNMALVTLDEDPGLIFLANLPGTPPGEVPIGAPVEIVFEDIDGAPGQKIHEWRVVGKK